MAKLTVDITGKNGLAAQYFGDSDQLYPTPQRQDIAQVGEMVGGFFEPFSRIGYMSPSVATLGAMTFDNALAACLTSTIYDAINDDLYFGERGRQLFHLDGLDDTSFVRDLDLGSSGTPVMMDLEIYQINGVRKLFYVYEKGDNFCVGIAALPFGSSNDDWLTSTVSGAFSLATTSDYNFMRTCDNGFAYFFQDNYVHKLDGTLATGGTNGTVTPQVLVFPTTFRLADAVDYRGNLYMVIHQTTFDAINVAANGNNFTTPAGVYVWDRQTTVVDISDFIPVQGIMAIKKIFIAPNGKLRLICVSSNKLVEIREFNGSDFVVIKMLGLGAAPQYPDSLTTAMTSTFWLGTDGSLYQYGTVNPGDSEVLCKMGYVKAPSTTSPGSNIIAGAIFFGASNGFSGSAGYRTDRQGFTVAYQDSGTFTAVKFFPFDRGTINSNNQLALTGDVYTPVLYFPDICKVNYVHLFHNTIDISQAATTQQGTISVFLNQGTTAVQALPVTRNDLVKGWKYIPIGQAMNKNGIYAIQFKINWATDQIMQDSTDWLPRAIEVDFEPITKLQ